MYGVVVVCAIYICVCVCSPVSHSWSHQTPLYYTQLNLAAIYTFIWQVFTFCLNTEMGVGGTLEYLSDLMGSGYHHKKKKKKQFQTVELKVRMDCDGCELKVKNALSSLSGEFYKLLWSSCIVLVIIQHEDNWMKWWVQE